MSAMVAFNPNVLQGAVYKVLTQMMAQLKMKGEPQDYIDVATFYDETMDSQHGRLNISPKTAEGAKLAKMFNDYMNKIEKTYGPQVVRKIPIRGGIEVIK